MDFQWPQNAYFEFTTAGDIPGSPGVPEVRQVGKEVFQLFWDEAENNGYVDVIYEIENRTVEEPDEWKHVTNTSVRQLILNDFIIHTNYEFRIRAFNEFGASNFSYSDKPFLPETEALVERANDPFGIIIASSVAVLVLVSVFLSALYMVYLRKEKCKKMLQDVSPATDLMPDVELATLQDLPLHANFVHQTNALYNLHDLPSDEELMALPQMRKEQIIVTKFLGSGAFGEVFEGVACGLSEEYPSLKVAIKTLKKGATEHEKEEFLKEAKLMSNFKHDHILQLLGVCFDNNPNFILLELMEGGDLLSYLRSHRPTIFQNSTLTMEDLLGICIDVSKGCKYLEDKHFVHRDLAARNCLVSSYDREHRIVKIGDFGLARDIYKSDYYRKEGEGLLPVRWMAPESLVYGVFTSQSDVWAFGVLLWEVMTLGQQPYPARNNMEVLYYVRAGGRLDKPDNCPDEIHEIMAKCWNYEGDNRPTFCYCLNALEDVKTRVDLSMIMPAVYNFDYYNQENVGTYIGRYDNRDEEENKFLDQNFDARSTQSGPVLISETMFETNPSTLRRSSSWTSAGLAPSDNQAHSTFKSITKKPAKYLELLGDNEDSDGYQLPLQLSKQVQQTLCTVGQASPKELINASSSTRGITSSVSLNHLPSTTEPSNFESKNFRPSPALSIEHSSGIEELNSSTGSSERQRSNSTSSAKSGDSWLDNCDSWSFSTASTATCTLDTSLSCCGEQPTEISAMSCLAGIDLNFTPNASQC